MRDNYFHEDSHFFQVLYQPCYLRAQLHVLGFLKESMTPVDLINSFCTDFHVRSASVLRNTFWGTVGHALSLTEFGTVFGYEDGFPAEA